MARALLILLLSLGWAAIGFAEESPLRKFPSPDGRFALRFTEENTDKTTASRVELVERKSGKVAVDLGVAENRYLPGAVLAWSADSRRVVYSIHEHTGGVMSVHFRKGSAFREVPLPDDLPDPRIRFRKGAAAEVRTYAATLTPIRWLPSGSLKITCEQTVLSLVENVNYTGTLPMTIGFNRSGHGFLQKLGKTKTTTDE